MENKDITLRQELTAFYNRMLANYQNAIDNLKSDPAYHRILHLIESHIEMIYAAIEETAPGCILSPGKPVVDALRRKFPVGCRIVLDVMDDPQAPPVGTTGSVQGVDDIGSILVKWDCGSTLRVGYGKDKCHRLYTVKYASGPPVCDLLRYPSGSRVMLDREVAADIPAGTKGTVQSLDGTSNVLVRCDGGKQVRLDPDKHRFHRIWDATTDPKELAMAIRSFYEENHYCQSPTIIGYWRPDILLDMTIERLYSGTQICGIIRGLYQFRTKANLPQKERARADKLLHDLYIRFECISPAVKMARMEINEFVRREYKEKNGADFSNLFAIPIARTENEDGVEVQVYINLIDYQICTYADGTLVETVQHTSLLDLIMLDLLTLDFDTLVALPDKKEAT